MSAPERIWIDRGPKGGWMKRFERMPDSEHEYVRADIPAARIAELEAALKAARSHVAARAHGYAESDIAKTCAENDLKTIDAALNKDRAP